ncbi:DUF1822 family protein [Kamptonema animale CS-326]|jgi:hypothetical protein|uniref:DUF1822 family protein n=1 Tax=Kamptonema animale TaxID=92934 RepID=UPI00232D6E8B|nr:DUF1822 family protein [Kamptonema animale]MDB9514120.1 DUF1822 family protein [Kamptonema animale CS-326]
MNIAEIPLLTVPLELKAHELARQLAAVQSTAQKGKRVYLNALAVYAVHSYLKWLQIETDFNSSDSFNPAKTALANVADLLITGIGSLECRPVLPGETSIFLPEEVIENRIGYVGVQFSDRLDSVQLLGFAPSLDSSNPPQQIAVAELMPIDALIEQITRLEEAIAFLETDDPVAVQVRDQIETQSRSNIVAQLERIYRTCEEYEWRYAAGEMLAGSTAGGEFTRESADSADTDLQDLAEALLEKLAEIWRDAA